MADIEKVIKGLESCKHPFCQTADCPYAPWDRDLTCKDELFDDALELLKEQKHRIYELEEQNEYLQDKADRMMDNLQAVLSERSEE